MNPYLVRRLLAGSDMAKINEKCAMLLSQAHDINDLFALVFAGGRASDVIAGRARMGNVSEEEIDACLNK